MKRIYLFALLLLGFTGSAIGQEGMPVDVTEFDLGGVKLGMNPTEVASALKDKYEVEESDINIIKSSGKHPVLGGDLVVALELLSKGAEKATLGMRKGWKLNVAFAPKVPYNEKDVVAHIISYELPFTPGNVASVKASAIEKYGTPTVQNPMGGISWCSEIEGWGGCKSDDTLTILNTAIELRDASFMKNDMVARQEEKNEKATF